MDLYVLNSKVEAITVLDAYSSLIWTDRFQSCGDVELYIPMDIKLLDYIIEDNYLVLNLSEHGMIIEDIAIDSDIEDGDFLTVTGRSLESILDRRIVWGQKVLSGKLQDCIETLLNENIISPADSNRKIENFIFKKSADEKITSLTLDTQYTGDNLYDIIKALCEANNIGFKIVFDENNRFVFSLYAGKDRSYDQTDNPYVIFSPDFDNIVNSNYYTSKANLKNVTLIAGEGEGSDRKMATVGSASGLNRRELFTDARDISSETDNGTLSTSEYTTQLEARGTEKLAEYTHTTAFEGEAEATQMFRYGEDFFIGDIVQIANEYGHEGRAYISELIISHDNERFSVYPTFQTIQEGDEA